MPNHLPLGGVAKVKLTTTTPRKIKTEEGEEGRGTRRVGLDPIGWFLGGQEGRGGYIALEISILQRGNGSCISRSTIIQK